MGENAKKGFHAAMETEAGEGSCMIGDEKKIKNRGNRIRTCDLTAPSRAL